MSVSDPLDAFKRDVPSSELHLDADLGCGLVMTFLTGVYAAIFVQTIVPVMRNGGRRVYAGILSLLFACVTAYVGYAWYMIRNIFVAHDATPDSMYQDAQILNDSLHVNVILDTTMTTATILADIIMVWRCATIWVRPKMILAIFSTLFIVDAVMVITLIDPKLRGSSAIPTCLFVSFTITAMASSLIIYRILSVPTRNGVNAGKYHRSIEIVAESGVLYAIPLLIVSVLMVLCDAEERCDPLGPLSAAFFIWRSALGPITGIAPTLIAFRVETGRLRDQSSTSQPQSTLRFQQTLNQTSTDTSENYDR